MLNPITWIEVKIKGQRRKPVCKFLQGYTTTMPEDPISEEDWKSRYRLSYMCGWRSQPIHIENNEIQALSLKQEARDA